MRLFRDDKHVNVASTRDEASKCDRAVHVRRDEIVENTIEVGVELRGEPLRGHHTFSQSRVAPQHGDGTSA